MSDPTTPAPNPVAPTEARPPYRIVDARNVGWIVQDETTQAYRSFDPTAAVTDRVVVARLADIAAEHGPIRPVEPCTDADAAELRAAFELAGRKAVASLASAVEMIHYEARTRFGPWDADPAATAAYAERTLKAGRPGSWESELLSELWIFGSELNLFPRTGSRDVAEMRRTGPNTQRVHVEARDRIAAVLRRWTSAQDRYTELAENLARIVSSYADDRHGAEGWRKIADQWLQPDARLPAAAAEPCYRLLYSQSAHYHPY